MSASRQLTCSKIFSVREAEEEEPVEEVPGKLCACYLSGGAGWCVRSRQASRP